MAGTTEQFAEQVFQAALGAMDTLAVHIGDRLGYYRALSSGPHTPRELAAATGTDERYTREWLEQQATSGVLEVDLEGSEPRFRLPAGHRDVLANPLHPDYLAPLARMIATAGGQVDRIVAAYRSGGGISWASYGPGMRESQADMNRPFFENTLAQLMSGLPRVHELLNRPGALLADVGCGAGWSTIALARAYPGLAATGFDLDAPSIAMAQASAHAAGLGERVLFLASDIVANPRPERFDVVTAFECIHDLPQPVPVLAAMRQMVTDDGAVIVMDEAVGEAFTGNGDDIERMMYGFSLLVCLPASMSSSPSVATGTAMRPATLHVYAEQAGFRDVVVREESGFFRFYELVP